MTDVGDDGAVRDRVYTMFDASGTITVDMGGSSGAVTGTVTAHIPVGEGAESASPAISFRLRGSVPSAGSSAMIFQVLSSLVGTVIAQLEHGPEHGSLAARRLHRLQAGLSEVSAAAEISIGRAAHDGATASGGRGTVGIELELGLGHGDPTVTLRLVHQVTASMPAVGDFTYDAMTEIPLRAPPGLSCEVEPHFSPESR
jgi:hypothetical protein